MQRFRSIVVVLEPGQAPPPALDRVLTMAQASNATLNIVSVIEDVPTWAKRVMPHSIGLALDAFTPQVERQLNDMAVHCADRLSVRTQVLHGRSCAEIARIVEQSGADLVVKAADEDVSAGLDCRLLRRCPCAVWLLKGSDAPFRRVAAALHLETHDSPRDILNSRIMELASSVATLERSELHAIQAWSYFAEAPLRHKVRTAQSESLLEQAKRRSAGDLKSAIERFVAPYRAEHPELTLHMAEGDPEDVLPSVVQSEHEDLVVMGSINRSGVSGFLMGSLTERLLNRLPCSILAVKAAQLA